MFAKSFIVMAAQIFSGRWHHTDAWYSEYYFNWDNTLVWG